MEDLNPENAGVLHNMYLEQAFLETNFQQAITRSDITVDAFVRQMASSQVALLANFPSGSMTNNQIDIYIDRTLDTSIAPEIYLAAQSIVQDGKYSFTDALKAKFSLTTQLEGYLREIESIYKANLSDMSRESKRKRAYLNWYRAANTTEDRDIISGMNNILDGSEQYWKENALKWQRAANVSSQVLVNFVKGLAISDACSFLWACRLAGPYALVFWKEMLLAGAAGSAKSAIGCLIGAIWTTNSAGEMMLVIPGQEPILQEKLRMMIHEEITDQYRMNTEIK